MSTITAMTAIPDKSPTLVMISMGDSTRTQHPAILDGAWPKPVHVEQPYGGAIKEA
jgi:hypothetical protein